MVPNRWNSAPGFWIEMISAWHSTLVMVSPISDGHESGMLSQSGHDRMPCK